MLSRRLIRIKVLQALYSYFQVGDNDLPAAEKQLIRNIERIYELYIYALSFLVELHDFHIQRSEEAKQKFLPSDQELNPNTKFLTNRLALQLASNKDFLKKRQQYKINWADETEMFRTAYNNLKSSDEYMAYLNSAVSSYENDRNFMIHIVLGYMHPSPALQSYFEEKNIHWADDYDTAMMMLITTLRSFKASHNEFRLLPALFSNDEEEAEVLNFGRDLFRKTIIYSTQYAGLINAKADNWELDRIALIDIIILKMAITEVLHFNSIPLKVTLNEYIEVAKQYSTPKSKIFVNGILDKLIVQFRENNEIHKIGRGLIDD